MIKWTSEVALWKRWISLWEELRSGGCGEVYKLLTSIKGENERRAVAMVLTMVKWHPLRGRNRGGDSVSDCGLCQLDQYEFSLLKEKRGACSECPLYKVTGMKCGDEGALYTQFMLANKKGVFDEEAADDLFDIVMEQYSELWEKLG